MLPRSILPWTCCVGLVLTALVGCTSNSNSSPVATPPPSANTATVVGTYTDSAALPQAFCLRDGTFLGLSLPANPTMVSVSTICEVGDTLYLPGTYSNAGSIAAPGPEQACYWTIDASSNVTRTDLAQSGDSQDMAASITSLNGILTITGQALNVADSTWHAFAWTADPGGGPATGVVLNSPPGERSVGVSTSISAFGTVWTAGSYVPQFNLWHSEPMYWQDGETGKPGQLPEGALSGWIQALYAADESDIFAGGWWDPGLVAFATTPSPFYYKNWEPVDLSGTLPAGQPYGSIQGMTGEEDDVFMAGWYGTSLTATVPCYWNVNGDNEEPSPVNLSLPAGGTGQALKVTLNEDAPVCSGYFTLNAVDHPCYWSASGALVDLSSFLPAGAMGGRAYGIMFQ